MTYLVTGGAGFIGSHIVDALVCRGKDVRVVDNLSTGDKVNLTESSGAIEFWEADIRELEMLHNLMRGVDYVIHQAALPSVTRSVEDPISSNQCNIDGTLNVLVAAKDAKVRRVVIASSSSVYGNTPTLPKREDMCPSPISPYALTKYACEGYGRLFHSLYGLETVMLRYFNVFGPRQNPTSQYAAFIPIFINAYLAGQPPTIYGDGEQSRDFTYVANVVEANLLACHAKGVAGEVFNIACGEQTTINQVDAHIRKLTGSLLEPLYGEARLGDVKHSLADISKAQRLLGYSPNTDLEQGLRRTTEWFTKNNYKHC